MDGSEDANEDPTNVTDKQPDEGKLMLNDVVFKTNRAFETVGRL
jgi:hypothetical protein